MEEIFVTDVICSLCNIYVICSYVYMFISPMCHLFFVSSFLSVSTLSSSEMSYNQFTNLPVSQQNVWLCSNILLSEHPVYYDVY